MRFLLLLLLLTPALKAQTWAPVGAENESVSVTIPAASTYRFGSGTCWSASITVTKATTFNPLYYTSFPFADPCPGVVKSLQLLETSATQAVTVVTNGISSTLTIPALAPPSQTFLITCTATGTLNGTTLTLSNASCTASP